MVEERANLDYGRDDRPLKYVIIDDDGVAVTPGMYEVTDGMDDEALYDPTADSDYVPRER